MSTQVKGDEKILSRIKAALDLANHPNTSLKEKEAALLAVQRLMQNNHIEHSRVTHYTEMKDAAGNFIAETGEEVIEDEIFYDEKYEAYLLHYIAMNNFCKVLLKEKTRFNDYEQMKDAKSESMIKLGDTKNTMCIIGEPTNVTMCIYLYSFFRNAILQLSVSSYSAFLVEMEVATLGVKLPNSHKTKFIANYISGCVDGIKNKMAEQKQRAQLESATLTGLVRIKADAVAVYMKKHYPTTGNGGGGMGGNNKSSAYSQGVRDGYGLSANKAIG